MATVPYFYFCHLQPFLKMYQVDKLMMPFLVPDLLKLVKTCWPALFSEML